MADQDDYRRYAAAAEGALERAGGPIDLPPASPVEMDHRIRELALQAAQVWATLALAAAQDRVRPLDQRSLDNDGQPIGRPADSCPDCGSRTRAYRRYLHGGGMDQCQHLWHIEQRHP